MTTSLTGTGPVACGPSARTGAPAAALPPLPAAFQPARAGALYRPVTWGNSLDT